MSKTYGDLIEEAIRYLTPTAIERSVQIITDYVAGSGVLVVDYNNPAFPSIRPGTILACGLQLWYVQSITTPATGTLSVVGGFQGSTDANVTHSASSPTAQVYIHPRFSRFDVANAINQELDALSAPTNGLGQIISADVTYVPAFVGYALPSTFDNASSKILEISYKTADARRRFPLITRDRFRTIRNQSDPAFPSGAGVMVYPTDDGWTAQPGLPMHVQFLSPFTHLAALTDNALSVAGAPITMQDILTLGAAIRLAPTREVQRNSTSAQPDPRKATEVQAGAIANSVSGLLRLYTARINQEQSRLRMQFPEAEGGW